MAWRCQECGRRDNDLSGSNAHGGVWPVARSSYEKLPDGRRFPAGELVELEAYASAALAGRGGLVVGEKSAVRRAVEEAEEGEGEGAPPWPFFGGWPFGK